MAARRLIIVLVVLFVVSVLAAALAPEQRPPSSEESSTDSTTEASTSTTAPDQDGDQDQGGDRPSPPTGPETVRLKLSASTEDPPSGRARVGDQLALVVTTERYLPLEIPALGITEDAFADFPARINLILREAGRFPILAAGSQQTVARLIVAERNRSARPARRDKP